jgi:hypothetical protein
VTRPEPSAAHRAGRDRRGRAARTGAAVVLAVAAGAVAIAGPAATPAGSQELAAITQVGWWSQRPGATAQPDGGFEVAVGVGGQEQSAAALRLEAGGELASAFISLDEATAVGIQAAGLRACTTTGAWGEANPGDYEDRPPADCDDAVDLTRDDAGGVWTGDVTSLLDPSGTTLILLEPVGREVVAGLPVVPGFQIQFSGAQVLATGSSAPPVDDLGTAPPAPTFDPPAGGGFDAPSFAAPSLTEPGFAGPDLGTADLDLGGPETAAPAPATQTLGEERPSATDDLFAGGPISGIPGDPKPWWRLVLLVPLSAAVGVGAALGRRWWHERGAGDVPAPSPA